MKQTEKLDIILKELYKFKFDGKYYAINEILSKADCDVTRDEGFALAKRLDNEGLIKMLATKDDVFGSITSYGAEYCEIDSHTYAGSAVITNNYEIKIENSPGASIVSQSKNVTINTQVNDIAGILTKILTIIDKDDSIDLDKREIINECAMEIQNNLNVGKVPNFGLKTFLGLVGDISSVSSLALTLGQMI